MRLSFTREGLFQWNRLPQNNEIFSFLEDNLEDGFYLVKDMPDGLIHSVFKIIDLKETHRFILKVRLDHYNKLPLIKCEPTDIKYEKKIYDLISNTNDKDLIKYFPQLIAYSPDLNLILEQDVLEKPENSLRTRLDQNNVTSDMIGNVGSALGKFHAAFYNSEISIRGKKLDNSYYTETITFTYGEIKSPAVVDTITDLAKRKKHLILWDRAPKNIGIDKKKNVFFWDFEDAHYGHIEAELGYFLGHILVHYCKNRDVALKMINSFLNSYSSKISFKIDEKLVKMLSLMTLWYRVASKFVPYPIDLTQEEKYKIKYNTEELFANPDINWDQILNKLLD